MSEKNKRITIDLPLTEHKHLKGISYVKGKTIRNIFREHIEKEYRSLSHDELICANSSHQFNEETKKSLKVSEDNPIIECENLKDLWKKLDEEE